MSKIVIAVWFMVRSAYAQAVAPASTPERACGSYVAEMGAFPDPAVDVESVSGATAMRAPGTHRSEAEVRVLIEQLGSHHSYAQRRDAVWSLRGAQGALVAEALMRVAREDGHPNVRGYALEALGHCHDVPAVVPFLLAVLRDDDRMSSLVSAGAFEALGRTGDRRAYPVLVTALGEQSGYHASFAARGLQHLGDPNAYHAVADRVERMIRTGESTELILPALVDLGGERGLAFLCSILRAGQGTLREIADELRRHPSDRVRAAMLENLDRENPSVRVQSLRVLAKIGNAASVPKILDVFLQARGDYEKASAARALGEIGDARSTPALSLALANRSSAALRQAIAEALGDLGDRSAAETVAVELENEADPITSILMIEALGCMRDPRAIGLLVKFLQDARVTTQPPEINSVWGYPWNTRVADTALRSINLILGGAPPPRRDPDLPRPVPPRLNPWPSKHAVVKQPEVRSPVLFETVESAQKWWCAHRDDVRYRFKSEP